MKKKNIRVTPGLLDRIKKAAKKTHGGNVSKYVRELLIEKAEVLGIKPDSCNEQRTDH